MEKKSSKGLIITIVVLALLLVGVSGYLVYDKFFIEEEVTDNSKTENKEEISVQDEIYNQTITFSEIDSENIKNSSEKKDVILGGEKSILERIVTVNEDGSYSIIYKLNGKKIDTPWDGEPFYVINDILVYGGPWVEDNVMNPPTYLIILDKNANVIKTIKAIDSEGTKIKPSGFLSDVTTVISIDKNKILFHGSRLGLGGDFFYQNKNFDLCNTTVLEKNNIPSDYILSANYELEYLGNNQFSDINMIEDSIVTLSQLQARGC